MSGTDNKRRQPRIPALGSHHHRAYVGPYDEYDIKGALQFSLLTFLGLREHHRLLDIGCGSLRLGRLMLVYLAAGNYCGLERNDWLVDDAVANELTPCFFEKKHPEIVYDSSWDLSHFAAGPFDYVNIHSIFCHAPSREIRRCLSAIRRRIHDHTTVSATFAEGTTSYAGSDWVYPDVVRYERKSIKEMCREEGYAVTPLSWAHPKQQWFLLSHPAGAQRISRVAEVVAAMSETCPYWSSESCFSPCQPSN